MKKLRFPTEMAYVLGMLILALSTAMMERAGFGVSMVVAPAYILHLKISRFLPFFSFGMAEYTLQCVLMLLTALMMRRFRLSYLFSFVTAVLYGLILDGAIGLCALVPGDGMGMRVFNYIVGMILGAVGVSLLFRTYISPEVYELLVKELSVKLNKPIHHVKAAYDCISCLVAILMSFAFFGFGHFEGISWGTVICALTNGWIIGFFTRVWRKTLDFYDALPLRKLFEK